MPVSTLNISSDAWVDESSPNKNHAANRSLRLRDDATGQGKQSYLFAAAPYFPGSGIHINSATLYIYAANNWSGTHTVSISRVNGQWSENKITWNNAPGGTGTPATEVVAGVAENGEIALDVTNLMADVAAGAAWYGLVLSVDTDIIGLRFHASEATTARFRPRLEIDWRPPLSPPVCTAPVAGQAVGVESPTLVWRNLWDEGTQAHSQVQIASDSAFTTVVYDSTKTANAETQWSLEGEHQLTPNATRYWRAKVWDDVGQESEWSDAHEFVYKARGTLSITSPVVPSGEDMGVVEETTPPISATLTGGTVSQWMIEVYRAVASVIGWWWPVWSVGWTTSTTISATVPQGIIKSGEIYLARVRARDTEERTTTPGDPSEYLAELIFRYERASDEAISPVESLTVTTDGPAAILEWERAQTPDEFCVRVNGVEMVQGIDPEDVRVDSTTYRMPLWALRSGIPSEIEVEAVVDDGGILKHSADNPTQTVTTKATGVWLVDPDDSTAVRFVGEGGGSLDMEIREVAETYDLVRSPKPVRITDTLGGYTGSFSGMLVDRDGGIGESRDRFLELKSRFKELRLIAGDLNIPVRLEEVATAPTPIPGHKAWEASFAFFQVDEFELLYEGAEAPYLNDDLYLDDDLYLL